MPSLTNSLRDYHTFALPVWAQQVICIDSMDALWTAYQQVQRVKQPFLWLGEGSNTLFCKNFQGSIFLMRLKGLQITEQADAWHLRVAAGENWHQLVCNTVCQGIPGLENLALIPGSVGAAALQNIGAYGVEFQQFCRYVELLDLQRQQLVRLPTSACQFVYRDSALKRLDQSRWVITAVGLVLPKAWLPCLTYGELKSLETNISPQALLEQVCAIRQKKLPDPRLLGNAGSFFKNPVMSREPLNQLLLRYPELTYYPVDQHRVKVAAAGLIERCGLKAFRIGDAAVHQQQALVIVNLGQATPEHVITLAKVIRQQVIQQFTVSLEPEVCFIGSAGPINALEVLA